MMIILQYAHPYHQQNDVVLAYACNIAGHGEGFLYYMLSVSSSNKQSDPILKSQDCFRAYMTRLFFIKMKPS